MRYLISFFLLVGSVANAEFCQFSSMIFSPNKNKSCIRKFLKGIHDEQDRVEAQHFFRSWNPPKDLEISYVSNSLQVRRHGKLAMNAIWLSTGTPAILYVNGKILVSHTKTDSWARKVDNLFKSEKQASVWQSFVGEEAFAEDSVGKDLVVIYSILTGTRNGNGSPEDVMKNDHYKTLNDFLPVPGFWKGLISDNEVKCDGSSVVPQTYSQTVGSKRVEYKLVPVDPTKFKIEGLIPGKTYLVDVKLNTVDILCVNYWASGMEAACNGVWDKYFAANPKMKAKFLDGRNLNCGNLDEADQGECVKFFEQETKKFRLVGNGTKSMYECDDEKCAHPNYISSPNFVAQIDPKMMTAAVAEQKQKDLDSKKDYTDALHALGFKESAADLCSANGCRLPESATKLSVEQMKGLQDKARGAGAATWMDPLWRDEFDFAYQIENQATGESMMGQCCKNESCRKLMASKYGVSLKPQGEPADSSK